MPGALAHSERGGGSSPRRFLSPLNVAIRGDLARVLPATDASGAATRAAGSLVPAPTAGSVGSVTLGNGHGIGPLASPAAAVEARESVTRATAASTAACLAAAAGGGADKNAGTLRAAGVRLAKAYHLSPSGVAGDDARALMALVTARRAAVGDGWGPGFRLAAAKRCADVAEAISGRDPHLAAAALCAASESRSRRSRGRRAGARAEVRGGGVDGDERGHPGRPRVHLGGEVRVGVRGCVRSRELRSAISALTSARGRGCVPRRAPHAGGTGSSFESSTAAAAPRVVSAAGDVAAASFALLPKRPWRSPVRSR